MHPDLGILRIMQCKSGPSPTHRYQRFDLLSKLRRHPFPEIGRRRSLWALPHTTLFVSLTVPGTAPPLQQKPRLGGKETQARSQRQARKPGHGFLYGRRRRSRIENRSDMHLSTSKQMIAAMGGKVKIIAQFHRESSTSRPRVESWTSRLFSQAAQRGRTRPQALTNRSGFARSRTAAGSIPRGQVPLPPAASSVDGTMSATATRPTSLPSIATGTDCPTL